MRNPVRSSSQRPAIRCAIYTRKSTAIGLEQEFNSLDAQREACEHYIRSRADQGWIVLPTDYSDGGFTGANLERPAFQRLLADIDAGMLDLVVVYKVDRLSRSLLDFARVMQRLNDADVSFVSVTQNFSTADAMGRLTLNMLMSFAEFEREMIGERTRDKIAASRRKGKWTGGPLPIGFDVVDKKLVINEYEAAIVRQIFDLYIQHQSCGAVAVIANERGWARKARKGHDGTRRAGKHWNKDTILRVLHTPLYAGYITLGSERHEGEHSAIIDREVFHSVQTIIESHENGSFTSGTNDGYLLTGLVRCTCCGGAYTPASTKKRGREYRYYRCVTRDKRGRAACPGQQLPAGAIEEFVVEQLKKVTADPRMAASVGTVLKERIAKEKAGLEVERRTLPRRVAELSNGAQDITLALNRSPGANLQAELEARLKQVTADSERCQTRLGEVERRLAALYRHEADVAWITEALSNFASIWDVMSQNNRKRLIQALVLRVNIDEPAGLINAELFDPFAAEQAAYQSAPIPETEVPA